MGRDPHEPGEQQGPPEQRGEPQRELTDAEYEDYLHRVAETQGLRVSRAWEWDDRPPAETYENCGSVGCPDYVRDGVLVKCDPEGKGTCESADPSCRCLLFWSDLDDREKPWQPVLGNERLFNRLEIYGCFCVRPTG